MTARSGAFTTPAGHGRRTRKSLCLALGASFSFFCCLALVLAFSSEPAAAQGFVGTARSVHGRVLTPSGAMQANAVVYLENQKDQTVKTYITPEGGEYRFVQLNPNVNYQIWAKYKDMRSKSRTISSFESRHDFQFDLRLVKQK